ncbi:MAG: hypothetical protein Q7S32_04240 [bacterium]|nr:hypothetical protein [bacterium]
MRNGKYLTALLIFLLFAGVVYIQQLYDIQKSKAGYIEPIVFKPEVVRAANLGLHNAAADLMWLAAIQYFGGGESRTDEKLDDYLFLSADLDPKFAYPYAFGALILPGLDKVDKGIELATRGVELQVPDYRIPYYLGTSYYIDKNDNANAAKYFDIAAHTPGAPAGIQKVAANFGIKGDRRANTKQIWIGIYESSKDEIVKERAKNYIVHLQILDLLDEASKQYYIKYKKYPASTDDLVTGKILKGIPEDPFGSQFFFNDDGSASIK